MKKILGSNNCDEKRCSLFLEGTLSSSEEQAFTDHLASCDDCRQRLQQLAAGSDFWDEARSLLQPDSDDHQIDSANGLPLIIRHVIDSLAPTDQPDMLGRLGAYEVSGVVGSGGMGVVLRALDSSLERTVAIKVLSPYLASSGAARQRFAREAKAAAAVLHPNVIAIHAVSSGDGLPYFVMPYVRGESLQKRIDTRGALPVAEVLRIGAQVADGLAAAAAQGLVHRDIKPANILLEEGTERVTITDFGLARAADDATITRSGIIAGTPQFMSPEQARAEAVDHQSDLFSLGSVLYTCCTGHPPFRAETAYGVMRRITDEEPRPIRESSADVPDWLCQVISRLMAKQRVERFGSASDLAVLLRQCLAHVSQPLAVPLPTTLKLFCERENTPVAGQNWLHKWRVPMSMASVTIVVAAAWLIASQIGDTKSEPPGGFRKPHTKSVQSAERQSNSPSIAATEAGDYHIEVVEVADLREQRMTTEFDISRMKLQRDFKDQAAGPGITFGVGGASGGFGVNFFKPNIGLALKIKPLKSTKGTFVKLSSRTGVIDEQGQLTELKELGPTIHHFTPFEHQHRDAHFVYLNRKASDTPKLLQLDGQLLVYPGRQLAVMFEGTDPQTKSIGKDKFALESVRLTGDGIQVSIRPPATTKVQEALGPKERFEAMVANRSNCFVLIEDDDGQLYSYQNASNVSAAAEMSVRREGPMVRGSAKSPANPTQSFTFGSLPDGRSIKAIHVRFEDRHGDPTPIDFQLKDIPLDTTER